MKTFAIVGNSRVGKTHLICRLIPEFKRRGKSVAVIKHCHHGFSLSPEGKDSWKIVESGSDSVCMVGPDGLALLRKDTPKPDLSTLAARYFHHADIVLVEGGRKEGNLAKIEVLRKGVSERIGCAAEEVLAVVSDLELDVDKPVYHPDQIVEIADLVESHNQQDRSRVHLEIDGASVPIKGFVQRIFERAVLGMISTLKGIKQNPKRITLSINIEETTDE